MPRGPGEASWCREAKTAARQFLLLICRAIALTTGATLKEEDCPLLWGRGNLGGILRDNFGEGNWESKIAARQWGVNFCREASKCLGCLCKDIFKVFLSPAPLIKGVHFVKEFSRFGRKRSARIGEARLKLGHNSTKSRLNGGSSISTLKAVGKNT